MRWGVRERSHYTGFLRRNAEERRWCSRNHRSHHRRKSFELHRYTRLPYFHEIHRFDNVFWLITVGMFDNDEHFKFYDDNIDAIMRSILHLTEQSRFPEVMKEIREIYLKNQPISKENVWNLIRLITDVFGIDYNRKIIDLRNNHAKAPTYVYMFSYLGDQPTFYQYDHGPQPLKG